MLKISDLRQAVSEVKQKEAEAMTKELLSQGLDPLEILEEGVVRGLTELGDKFAAKKAIVLDLVKGGITAKACIPHIQAAFPKDSEVLKEKKIVLGTMLSQHNIGKNLVSTLLSIGGFEVIDIGEKTEPWDFYEKAEETGADMIAVSVVFSPAKQKFAELIDLLKQLKVRVSIHEMSSRLLRAASWRGPLHPSLALPNRLPPHSSPTSPRSQLHRL